MTVLLWALGGAAALTLALNWPNAESWETHLVPVLVYIFLTGFALIFGAWISDDILLSPAHVIGIVAFLSLPEDAFQVLLWTIFAGGVLGVSAVFLWDSWRGRWVYYAHYTADSVFILSRLVLSFWVAGRVYLALEGPLPVRNTLWEAPGETAWVLLVYGMVYTALYFALFLLRVYANGHSITQMIRTKYSLILIVLLLPIPFAAFSADVDGELTETVEYMRLLGVVVVIAGLHALSHSEKELRRQYNELHTLADIRRSMRSHLRLDDLLMAIYKQVHDFLSVNHFAVALYELDRARLEFALVMRGGDRAPEADQETLFSQYTTTLMDHVLETGEPLLIARNVQATAQRMKLESPSGDVVSWMGAPLLFGERKLGVLTAQVCGAAHDTRRHFTQDDLRLFNIIADSASIAIDNALLYSQQSRRLEEMTTLNQIVALLSGTLSPTTVLDTVISSASALSEANAVAVYLPDDDPPHALTLVRSGGLSERFCDDPPVPLVWRDRDTPPFLRMPLAIPNIIHDDRVDDFRNQLIHEGMSSFMELPLSAGGAYLGVMVVYFSDIQYFNAEQIEVMRALATQVAQAIVNARVYTTTDAAWHRSVDQLLALSDIGRSLAALIDLSEIGTLTLTQALEATGSDRGLIAVYDERGADLQVIAQAGYPPGLFKSSRTLWRGINKQVLISGKIHLVNDVSAEPEYVTWDDTVRSQLGVPILRGVEQRGFITLESTRLNGFSPEDTHFVAQIANQAVIAIDNARLFARITESRDRQQAILNAMEEAVLLVNIWGKIVLVNPRVAMLGLEPNHLLNSYITDLLQDTELAFHYRLGFRNVQEIARVLYDMGRSDLWQEYTGKTYGIPNDESQGERYIQRYILPVMDENKKTIGTLMVFYDKTEEQELNRAREELSRMIVHDLRSPLTAVTTSLRLLQEVTTPDNAIYDVVQMTTEGSRRALRKLLGRVDNLLDIAKMQSGRLSVDTEIVEFASLVEDVCDELTPLANELEITLSPRIGHDAPLLDIDADKIERLLVNLVDNALKYSPANSEIVIYGHPPGTNGAAEGYMRIDVIDNGLGVPDEYKVSLFKEFVQVEGRQRVRRGVGVGLTFCKLVAEAHGGRIWIEDNPEGGSIFAFTLPVAVMARLPDDDE